MRVTILFMTVMFVFPLIVTGCSKKKGDTTAFKDKKSGCDCPPVRICASEDAIARVKDRCIKWHAAQAKEANPEAPSPKLRREESFLTPVNPIGVVRHYREDGTLACREVDMNGDGLLDIHYFYDASGSNVLEIQQDNGRDGIIDVVRTFRSGVLYMEKYNHNGDESTWEVVKTYSNGMLTQIASRVINPMEGARKICPNHNYFENFDDKGNLVTISYDTDCDGRVDFVINREGKNTMNLQLRDHDNVIKLKETKPTAP